MIVSTIRVTPYQCYTVGASYEMRSVIVVLLVALLVLIALQCSAAQKHNHRPVTQEPATTKSTEQSAPPTTATNAANLATNTTTAATVNDTATLATTNTTGTTRSADGALPVRVDGTQPGLVEGDDDGAPLNAISSNANTKAGAKPTTTTSLDDEDIDEKIPVKVSELDKKQKRENAENVDDDEDLPVKADQPPPGLTNTSTVSDTGRSTNVTNVEGVDVEIVFNASNTTATIAIVDDAIITNVTGLVNTTGRSYYRPNVNVSILMLGNQRMSSANMTVHYLSQYYDASNVTYEILPILVDDLPLFDAVDDSVTTLHTLNRTVELLSSRMFDYIVIQDSAVHSLYGDTFIEAYVDTLVAMFEMTCSRAKLLLVETPLSSECLSLDGNVLEQCFRSEDESLPLPSYSEKSYTTIIDGEAHDYYTLALSSLSEANFNVSNHTLVLPFAEAYSYLTSTQSQDSGISHTITLADLLDQSEDQDYLLASMIFTMTTDILPVYAPVPSQDEGKTTALQQLAAIAIRGWYGAEMELRSAFGEELKRYTAGAAPVDDFNTDAGSNNNEGYDYGNSLVDTSTTTTTSPANTVPITSNRGDDTDYQATTPFSSNAHTSIDAHAHAATTNIDDTDNTPTVTNTLSSYGVDDSLLPFVYVLGGAVALYILYLVCSHVQAKRAQAALRRRRGYDDADLAIDGDYIDVEKQGASGYNHDDGL